MYLFEIKIHFNNQFLFLMYIHVNDVQLLKIKKFNHQYLLLIQLKPNFIGLHIVHHLYLILEIFKEK